MSKEYLRSGVIFVTFLKKKIVVDLISKVKWISYILSGNTRFIENSVHFGKQFRVYTSSECEFQCVLFPGDSPETRSVHSTQQVFIE